jgi:hypothetical protein
MPLELPAKGQLGLLGRFLRLVLLVRFQVFRHVLQRAPMIQRGLRGYVAGFLHALFLLSWAGLPK